MDFNLTKVMGDTYYNIGTYNNFLNELTFLIVEIRLACSYDFYS